MKQSSASWHQLGFTWGTLWTFCERAGFHLSVDIYNFGERYPWKEVQSGTWQRDKMCPRNIVMRFAFSKCDFIVPAGRRGEERALLETGSRLTRPQAGEQNLNERKTWVAQGCCCGMLLAAVYMVSCVARPVDFLNEMQRQSDAAHPCCLFKSCEDKITLWTARATKKYNQISES